MNTLIFDIGKTHKKLVVYNESLHVIHQKSTRIPEISDEEGFPCDDLQKMVAWVKEQMKALLEKYHIQRINFAAYGASWVHIDNKGKVLTPLYNYLKPFPIELKRQFDQQYGIEKVAKETGSPYSGMLNSALQLYWLKYHQPEVFKKITFSLHLPQYFSYLISGKALSEFTSIGCHSMLWHHKNSDYHHWVYAEGIDKILPPIAQTGETTTLQWQGRSIDVGNGIHDSSASLIPYYKKTKEPFILLSTGTWCVALNPFCALSEQYISNPDAELYYLNIEGKPVKATRLMLGKEYEEGMQQIADEFGLTKDEIQSLKSNEQGRENYSAIIIKLETLNHNLAQKQKNAIMEAKGNSDIRKLYIEGGFAKNEIFLNMLSNTLNGWEIILSEDTQGTALGAAMVLH